LTIARSSNILKIILKFSDEKIRNLDQKIQHTLSLNASELHNNAKTKSEDKHENDHANHKKISIMFITNELRSTNRSFFRIVDFINNSKIIFSRHDIHLDNQFRLLRENMLIDMRDELKILIDAKTDRHKKIIVDDFSVEKMKMSITRNRLR
jgi:hypothetical protein